MNFDDVLPYLSRGDFGKYQKKIYFLLCLPTVLCAFHKFAGVFLLAVPDHRCRLDWELQNATFNLSEDDWSSFIPMNKEKNEFSKCEYYGDEIDGKKQILECSEYIWNTTEVQSSAVKSFSLVCNRGTLRASADSMMMLGMLVGSYIFGDLSDRYGRRPTFMLSLLLQVISGIFVAISPSYVTYMVSRFIVGAAASGVFLVAYCLALEMVGKESRLYAGIVIQFFYPVGFIMLAGIAYLFGHDWRWFQTALTLPGVLFLFYWWFVPESPRWMLGHGHKDKAVELIQKVAKANKLSVPDEVLEKLEAEKVEKDSKKSSLLDLFKSPNLRTKSLLIFFNWFVISGTYYGLSWSTNDLGSNKLMNFMLSGFIEFPANYFVLLTLNRYGRKKILTGSMITSGVVLLLSIIVPVNQNWLKITFAILGKGSITVAYSVIYIFSAEQFPTIIRNVALGACSMSARIGGISAPYLIYLSQFWKPAPFFIFGVTAFMGGFCSTFLPETHNKELPETIADGERLGKTVDKHEELSEVEALNGMKN